MITILIILAILLLGVLVFIRSKPIIFRKIFLTQKTQANILSIDELSEDVAMQYYSIKYYYPIIQYSYQVNDRTFTVFSKNKSIYRKSSIDSLGEERKDSDFFWRSLKTDEPVNIIYCKFKPSWSLIVF
tara:strand:+ start:357 stop:743 length:387 start_codon:yes stop_codon:yes gene_type:complete